MQLGSSKRNCHVATLADPTRIYTLVATHRQGASEKNVAIDLLKITFNHVSVINIMVLFPLNWSEQTLSFFRSVSFVSLGSSEALAPSCLVNGAPIAVEYGSHFFVRALVTAVLPLFAVMLCVVFWRLRTSAAVNYYP